MGNNILIIHHNDRDGIVSAAVIMKYLKDSREGGYCTKCISVDYSVSLQDAIGNIFYDELYLLDYSITTLENIEYLCHQYNIGRELHWIDHHKTSSVILNSENISQEYRDILSKLDGLRVVGMAACGLCWIYSILRTAAILPNGKPLLDFAEKTIHDTITKEEALSLLKLANASPIVIYSHRYDIFDMDDSVTLFSYGYNPTDPRTVDEYLSKSNIELDTNIVEQSIENGKIIEEYMDIRNSQITNQFGFESVLTVMYGDEKKVYHVFVANIPIANSLCFGEKMDKYDICIPFYWNGKSFTYSMYTRKYDINCGDICMKLGGGGHAKAAGFACEKMIFEPDKVFAI